MKKLLVLLLLLASCAKTVTISKISVTPEGPIYGQDFYAADQKNFRIGKAVQFNPNLKAFGVLDTTFSSSVDSARHILGSLPVSNFRIHLLNFTCVTNHNCGRYETLYGYTVQSLNRAVARRDSNIITKFIKRLLIYKELSSRFGKTRFLISPGVEHHLSKESWRVLADEVLKAWPEVQLVNSPGAGINGERYRGAWLELHGGNPRKGADVYSLDGTDATDIDVDKYLELTRSAKLVFWWTRSYNCRNQGAFQDPRRRTSCPSDSTFELMAHIEESRLLAPTFQGPQCGVLKPFEAPQIYKPLAEDSGNGDIRSNKPVAITPFKGNKIFVLDFKGKVLGSLGYYGPYKGTLSRHYSNYRGGTGQGGYGFEKLAKKSSGSPYTFLQDKRACTGPIITGRRAGLMR